MKHITIFLSAILLLSSCIGDDFIEDRVDPFLRITNQIESLEVGSEYQFDAVFFNNIGQEEQNNIIWASDNEDVISITPSGLAVAHAAGTVTISAFTSTPEGELVQSFSVEAGETTVEVEQSNTRTGVIRTTTFYDLAGDFELSTLDDGNLRIAIADNYVASDALPGLYVYLTNNPRSIADAFEIGEVSVFSGAHSYEVEGVNINDYNYILYFCKPFNVKVGDGKIED